MSNDIVTTTPVSAESDRVHTVCTSAAPPRRGADVQKKPRLVRWPTGCPAGGGGVPRPGAMAPWRLVAAAWLVLGAVTAHGASPGALEP